MKFLPISKILLIFILPFLLFLVVINFYEFNNSFYQEKFLEYKVQQDVPELFSLHQKIVNFVTGKNEELPNELNEREKQHLWDVRNVLGIATILLYILIILFIILLIASALTLKVNNYIINFVGKVLVFGGFLTVLLAAVLFFFIRSDFSTSFESFHKLLFGKGSYLFDPTKEVIVRLYPEQLFMDLGIKISEGVILTSAVLILLGGFLILKSKNKKNKRG